MADREGDAATKTQATQPIEAAKSKEEELKPVKEAAPPPPPPRSRSPAIAAEADASGASGMFITTSSTNTTSSTKVMKTPILDFCFVRLASI
ncbi:hypothetical protein Prudu_020060 [Prunus dulcis]|uniref:Uncharacterized protein n=1 Tax=Prunus dulcis TaxID=3755 RepID=A0A4Y1RUF2_PRUDU|nr:hypothetical protein Prudu_020060 [Prunus dulcis]